MKLNSLREFISLKARRRYKERRRERRREEEIKINYILNNLTHKIPFAIAKSF
jgi:hypothetical protein